MSNDSHDEQLRAELAFAAHLQQHVDSLCLERDTLRAQLADTRSALRDARPMVEWRAKLRLMSDSLRDALPSPDLYPSPYSQHAAKALLARIDAALAAPSRTSADVPGAPPA